MFCTHCGKALEEGAHFCPYCGTPSFSEGKAETAPPPGSGETAVPGSSGQPVPAQAAPEAFSQPPVMESTAPAAPQAPVPFVPQPAVSAGPAVPPAVPQESAPVQAEIPAFSPAFEQYIHWLEARLNQKAQYIPEVYSYMFYTERFSAALAKVKQYVFLTQNDLTHCENMIAYSAACMQMAL